MELNWTTFTLEIINFLVLVWLLKRFLYKPVWQAIERRRQAIEDDLASARDKNQQAEILLGQQKKKLVEWEAKQIEAESALHAAIEQEREKRLAELDALMASAAKREQAIAEHQKMQQWKTLEQKALEISGRFASQLLTRFSGPVLEQLMVNALLDDLAQLPPEQNDKLKQAVATNQSIEVASVYPIEPTLQQRLLQVLQSFAPRSSTLTIHYSIDSSLLSGVSITIDGFQVHANLAYELRFFTEGNHSG